jgi:hypothetical protein
VPFLHGVVDIIVRDKTVARTLKGRTFGKRLRAKPECSNGIRNRDLKEWLRLGSERTSLRIFGKTNAPEFVKRIAGSSLKIRKTKNECQNIVEEAATS